MWRIYVILTIWLHPLGAQHDTDITNDRRGLEGNWKNTFTNTTEYLVYNSNRNSNTINNNNAFMLSTQLPDRGYNENKNTGDSFEYTTIEALAQDHLLSHEKESGFYKPQQNENTHTENGLSAKPSVSFTDSITTERQNVWEIPTGGDAFDAKLFDKLSSKAQYDNLVFSPISLQTLLAFIFTMSGGTLYEELAQLLAISNNSTHVASIFENIIQKSLINIEPTVLIMANKLFYDYRFGQIDARVRNFAKKSFDTEMEQIDFSATKKAANVINAWVSAKTYNLVQYIVPPSSITGEMSAILMNSIYFKSEWETKFDTSDTSLQDFFTTKQSKSPAIMMFNEDVFHYGDFTDDLEATVVQLPYKNSNFSMMVILPKAIEGLGKLERKLRYYDFGLISEKLKREMVTVKLPRFRIEYEIDLMATLQEMGLHALFNNVGSINLFKTQQKPLKIDQFKQKSCINVNEAGTEATAASVAKYVSLSKPKNMKYFIADHPFVFVIRDKNLTVFMGHVIKF